MKKQTDELTDEQITKYEKAFSEMAHTTVIGRWLIRDDPYIFTLEDGAAMLHIHENEAGEARAAACWYRDDADRTSDFICRLCMTPVPKAVRAVAKSKLI